jgi:hypothetical protein
MASATSFTVCTQELLDTPAWRHPDTTEPPLSRADAVAISKQQLRAQFPRTRSWELVGTELLTTWLADDRWFYIVTWRPSSWRDDDQAYTARIGVLMNGKAIEFKVETKPNPKGVS